MSTLSPAVAAKAYAALAVAILIAGLTAWQAAAGDGMTGQDWATVALAVLAPIAVWLAPKNVDPYRPPTTTDTPTHA